VAQDGRPPDDHGAGPEKEEVAVTVVTRIRVGRFIASGLCNNVSLQAGVKQVKAGIKVQPQVATCNHVKKMELSIRTGIAMPKMKTKSSAKKRFRVRPGGTVKRGQAFKRHILTKKTTKTKRQLRGATDVHATNMVSVRSMMPFA
jgi:large subunit ribosomal protein L35